MTRHLVGGMEVDGTSSKFQFGDRVSGTDKKNRNTELTEDTQFVPTVEHSQYETEMFRHCSLQHKNVSENIFFVL